MSRRDEDFQAISDAELEVLKQLWGSGPGSPRVLRDALAEKGSDWAYTTVQTLLHRLLKKGYVTRKRQGATQVYTADCSQDELAVRHMDDLAARVYDADASSLVLSLVEGKRLNRGDLKRLRATLEAAEERLKKGNRG
ncbi:MAG: BlaI/MecI/CopY family transcriptional regulator [Planctomycetota bacterium]|nr:BlaI/MecI/CopY family transcriptional regulator [Planctomycetota bacterium]